MASSRDQLRNSQPAEQPTNDFCPTPAWATRALFHYQSIQTPETFEGRIWECCAGTGAMAKVIEKECPKCKVIATELQRGRINGSIKVRPRSGEPYSRQQDFGPVYGRGGVDFLSCQESDDEKFITGKRFCIPAVENIITNPPFSRMEAFVRRARYLARRKIAMLMPLSFLETPKRRQLMESGPLRLKHVRVFSRRIEWTDTGHAPGPCAWFIWERYYSEDTIIDFIP